MRPRNILLFVIILISSCYSQEGQLVTYQYLFVDTVPEFVEKEGHLSDFLYSNLQLPKNFSGTDNLLISFVISTTGSVEDIKVLRSHNNIFKNAIIKVFASMPKWRPGTLDGKPVRVKLYLELPFRLE